MNIINNLIRGNRLFKKYHLDEFKEDLDYSIQNGQKPEVLLISCCDSRVTNDFMFGNKPGDLFVLRNIGNFVPPYESVNDFFSVAAAIEYAVNILNVPNIIICGHSHCGACESLYKDIPDENTNIKKWLQIAQPVKEFALKNIKLYSNEEELYRATEKNSIVFQLKNLLTYPIIKQKYENKQIQIHGWYYNLSDGSIQAYNEKENIFEEIE
ncbi:carbonic anhydrase [Poseidonibacter lekithochrous]|uniref:carbonic anhydrase n=1 Tax=Poseidonibacter lekithochrous TaxID=1904463 RepID=UPI0008FCC2C3|nr:carbonic anhydrase [Poseidonibacter lekithochrous]QKJ21529.1 beta carbonic anhydrase, clade B [Poseidonibacter lekithochrous]